MDDRQGHQTVDMSEPAAREGALARLLAWYRELGADAVVGADAVDWLARGNEPPKRFRPAIRPAIRPRPPAQPSPQTSEVVAATRAGSTDSERRGPEPVSDRERPAAPPRHAPQPQPQPQPPPPSVTLSDEAAEANARDAARQARSLEDLHALLVGFDGCGLKRTAKNLCFYRGAADARVMVIGEAPGADEDRAGIPFVGRAGQLLDRMLAAIDLSEADTHITNVVYWRPPGNRVPTPQETLICRPFLERQIRLVQPELIVTVGGSAAKLVLGVSQGIMKTRGKWGEIDVAAEPGEAALVVPVMPTLHPAYLLRSPANKRHAWRDLLAIQARLNGPERDT